jgi:hypothetical protein
MLGLAGSIMYLYGDYNVTFAAGYRLGSCIFPLSETRNQDNTAILNGQ